MATNENLIPIPGRLHSVATEGHVAGADEIFDDNLSKDQQTINSEVNAAIGTGGSVDSRISAAINALDSTKSQSAGADGLALNIVEENGKITSISGSIASNTYDAYGSASSEASRAQNAESALGGRVTTLETAVGTGGSVDSRIAAAKSEIIGNATSACDTLGEAEALIGAEATRAGAAEDALDTAKADKATTLAGYGITDAYTKSETYTKTEVNDLVDTPHQEYVTVDAYSNLPATGSKDTIYRVSNYNGSTSQVDASVYSEYAWNGSQYIFLCVKSQIGEVFDISVYNNNAKYTDLADALGTNGEHVPQSLQKGGMSVKYVQSSDNNYVQYRLMSNTFNTNVANWQGVDDEPTAGSENLVKSGGVIKEISKFVDYEKTEISPTIVNGYALKGDGLCIADESSRMKKYNVTAGEILYVRIKKDNAGVYQFQNNQSVPSAGVNNYLIGNPITAYSEGLITVPNGATYFIISELATDNDNYVGLCHKPLSFNLTLKNCIGGRLIGKRLDTADGTVAQDNTKYVTPYIKVNSGDVVNKSGSNILYTYDSSFVKNHYYNTNPVTIPPDAVYIRTSLPSDGTGYLEINGVKVWDDTIALQNSSSADMESTIKGWVLGECMTVSGLSKNTDGAITQVRGNWPDGSYGTMTITRNADNLATQVVAVWLGTSYTLAITRDADGNVTETSFS